MEFIVVWIISAVVCAIIASSKGRSEVGWFFIGVGIGIFGVILIACLPSTKPVSVSYAEPIRNIAGKDLTTPLFTTKKCLDCAETVLKDAKVCKHCGYRFAPPDQGG
jgi:hypothetical protein